jgi:cytochrome P450
MYDANWQLFSSQVQHPPEQTDFTQSLNYTDPPKHQSLRSLVAKVFTPRHVEELAPRITQITHELIDRVQGQHRMDFVHDLAIPLPVIVIAEILGVPVADRADFKRWSDGIMMMDPDALKAIADYFRQLLKERRQHPGKDLISELIAAHDAGETLTAQEELVDFCLVLLVGQTIPAGQMVTVWMGAANRDETQFDRAEEFIIDRNPNPHVAFGNGIHFCLGAPLARLEAKLVLNAVLERLPNLRIDPGATLEFIPTTIVYGLASLPVLF